jgi:hypothetical protein
MCTWRIKDSCGWDYVWMHEVVVSRHDGVFNPYNIAVSRHEILLLLLQLFLVSICNLMWWEVHVAWGIRAAGEGNVQKVMYR